MVTYVCLKKFFDYSTSRATQDYVRDMVLDALFQTDFQQDEVVMRFSDFAMFVNAIRIFKDFAILNGYYYNQLRESEFDVYPETKLTQKTRYVFMNSVPDNYNDEPETTN
jgi:hypothetical protein